MSIPKFLYHYYEMDQGPFRNITENSFEKAVEIQENISVGFNSNRPPNYIALRFALEKRLKKGFLAKGGEPSRDDPFYFTLGACDWVKSLYENPGVVKIPLDRFDHEHISFTYPDSMVSFQFHDEPKLATYRKACNGQVYLLNELEELVKGYGLPSENKWNSKEALKYDRYIEVQIWDDTIIKEFQNKVA
ncbi:hypothetical protein U6A24_07210 [Aquimarina gracilis]|uniref:Uncharacterized protein n=1 Tax=Aquimarina gracilis TaxID=874422 RepID=A0ABU5ZT53_9FLAO|nr:hypothetical protein [Aquimarina gracilis]MEB3345240.1 hypothetical protein [Aquimarina gracilis]